MRWDFKKYKGARPSKGTIDLTLNRATGTVETRVLSFDSYTDNGYFGPNTLEFDAVVTGVPMVLARTTGWVVAKGQNNIRVCKPLSTSQPIGESDKPIRGQ